MSLQITTLEQASNHLLSEGLVDFNTMTVTGENLLNVCGYSYHKKNKTDKIKVQIKKHNFQEGEDFTINKDGAWVYQFSMNAANHVLLAAMTEKGKTARQQAIDLKTTVDENGGQEMLMDFIKQQQQFMVEMQEGFKSTLQLALDKKEEESLIMIVKKSEPISLTKMYNGSSKVAQAANIWLEAEGYQYRRYQGQKPDGWSLTDKGRELGTQINPKQVFWVPEIKNSLPNTIELLEFAERLGLKDMKTSQY